MQHIATNPAALPTIERRITELFGEYKQSIYKQTDRLFAILMMIQWLAGIIIAFWLSPRTWVGATNQIHLHVWAAIFLGSAISFFPIALALLRPGKASTRYAIALGQMLMGALLIHLSGGRIETHFHVFGSLAFLAFYRDWRVLVPATLVVAADHFLRGVFWPQSIYGVLTASEWRWVEHAGWVVFEDTFLLIAIKQSVNEMWNIAERTIESKSLNEGLERHVTERTAQLVAANQELKNEANERKQTEEALRQTEEKLRLSQRLEAVGQLAGGVAHDFNNLLTVITGYSELMLRRLNETDPQHHNLTEIKKAGERAASLTHQLLAFSRKQVLQPKVLDLNSLVPDTGKMLRRLIGEDIELVLALKPALGRVMADPNQIEQVIMNLVLNARDAMPRGGKIIVETRNVELSEAYADTHIAIEPGPYVMLAVSDTGSGIDAETQKHIFEPFFTTKEVGKGSGLGLATVYGIVKQSGGNIWVYSEVGQGTTFKIYLPRIKKEAELFKPAGEQVEILRGTETILLVEDEAMVRVLARSILEESGYHVLEADHGEEAMRVCGRYDGPIHLLLTDVIMPQMSGRELAERITPWRQKMKVLYMSGYTDDAIVHHGVLNKGMAFIEKPFTPDVLGRKVRDVLNVSLNDSRDLHDE